LQVGCHSCHPTNNNVKASKEVKTEQIEEKQKHKSKVNTEKEALANMLTAAYFVAQYECYFFSN